MNGLKLIQQMYDLKAKQIDLNYTLPPFSLMTNSSCCCSHDNTRKEIEIRQNAQKEKMEKLQENEQERKIAIEEYHKRQNEMISKMTERELLEAIYKQLNSL